VFLCMKKDRVFVRSQKLRVFVGAFFGRKVGKRDSGITIRR